MSDPQLQIPFAGGPNESVDPRHVPPGSVISSTNATYDADGTYQPRLGYTQLGASTTPTAIRKLAAFNSELVAIDGESLYSYNDGADGWTAKDAVCPVQVTRAPLFNSTLTFQSWGHVVANGYRVVAWIDANDSSANAAVYSLETGAQVYGPTLLPTLNSDNILSNVNIGVIGTTVVVVAAGQQALYAWTLSVSPLGTWSSSQTAIGGTGCALMPVCKKTQVSAQAIRQR